MNIKLAAVALLASATLIANVDAGNHHGNGGGGFAAPSGGARGPGGGPSFGSMPSGRFGGGPSFRSMPMRSFSGNRMIYSGQRFSSAGVRPSGVVGARPQSINPNFGAGQFARGNTGVNRTSQFGNNQRIVQNGNGLGRNNGAVRNRTGAGQFRNGNRLASNWRSHVVAQHSANWHRDWDRHRDHFFHGHRFVFIDGFWWGFGLGFDPWWPWWWDYPYGYGYYGYPYGNGYYGSGYGDGYGYGYPDPGTYNDQSGYDNGYNDQSGYQNGYGNQSANSSVAAAQDRLTQEGFYRGQIDGVLGPETRHAIVRFQTKHGLGITGELTPETLNAMGLRQYANY